MSVNGQLLKPSANGHVLHWPRRVLAAEDLRRSLNGHRELVLAPETVVTPLAAEQLRDSGVQVTRQVAPKERTPQAVAWGYTQDRPHPMVRSAIQSLERDGLRVK